MKLFREEGKTGAIECPACGAPITLHSFGAIEQVACSYCGTVCAPESGGSLDILQRAERERRASVIPLHTRGQIDGHTWEVIGITWREVVSEGVAYPWQEFLLFNPYQGYRWLIYSMSDGVWSFGGPLLGAAEIEEGSPPTATYCGQRYKHFSTGTARTTYVEGEFPWQVLADDVAQANDYVCPPKLISIEVQQTKHGSDLNFTQMRPIEADEVWSAFDMKSASLAGLAGPPPTQGIHPAAINPHGTKFYWIAGALLVVIWIASMIGYSVMRDDERVFKGQLKKGEVLSQAIEFGKPGKLTNLEFELKAPGMKNSWASAEIMLIDDKGEATALVLNVDSWSGVSGGESWSEGTNPRTETIGGVEGGKYQLQVSPQYPAKGAVASHLYLTITRDVPLTRYMLLPLIFIIAFPALNYARRASFETKRWSSSDHAPSSLSDHSFDDDSFDGDD